MDIMFYYNNNIHIFNFISNINKDKKKKKKKKKTNLVN